MIQRLRIGVDLGGTKIEAITLNEAGGAAWRRRIATPRGDYDGTIRAIRALVEEAERSTGAAGAVGIGIPGTPSLDTGLIKNANSTWLNGRPLQHDLQATLGRTVRLANDANCFTLSEAVDGAGRGAGVVFGVIIGTGCGGGIVVDGRVLNGANGIAGEWGHNPLPSPSSFEWPGPPCYCGRTGCIETFLSGPGMARDYAALGGSDRTAREIAERAGQGIDPIAERCLRRYEDRLARALTSVINLLDPDVIVLGGGVSNVERLYERVPPLLRPFGGDRVRTRVLRNAHGDSSGVRGAAWLGELL